jgi:hypothetical protein
MEILLGILAGLLTTELCGAMAWFARWLIHRAARKLPEQHRDVLLEDWLGNLNELPGGLSKLVWAIPLLLWGVQRISREIEFKGAREHRSFGAALSRANSQAKLLTAIVGPELVVRAGVCGVVVLALSTATALGAAFFGLPATWRLLAMGGVLVTLLVLLLQLRKMNAILSQRVKQILPQLQTPSAPPPSTSD